MQSLSLKMIFTAVNLIILCEHGGPHKFRRRKIPLRAKIVFRPQCASQAGISIYTAVPYSTIWLINERRSNHLPTFQSNAKVSARVCSWDLASCMAACWRPTAVYVALLRKGVSAEKAIPATAGVQGGQALPDDVACRWAAWLQRQTEIPQTFTNCESHHVASQAVLRCLWKIQGPIRMEVVFLSFQISVNTLHRR